MPERIRVASGGSYSPLYLGGVNTPPKPLWYEERRGNSVRARIKGLIGLEEYQMRRMLFLPLLAALVGVTVYGQQQCEFDITGTWRLDTSDTLYRFEPNGSLSVLVPSSGGTSSEVRETARA